MATTRRRTLAKRETRTRDRIGAALVVLLAIAAGLVAAHVASPKPWEHPRSPTAPQVK